MQINFFGPTCLLSRALPLPHRLQAAVPVEQLEDGHQLLELEHRLPPVGAQHEPEGADPGVGGVNGALRPALNDEQNTYPISRRAGDLPDEINGASWPSWEFHCMHQRGNDRNIRIPAEDRRFAMSNPSK